MNISQQAMLGILALLVMLATLADADAAVLNLWPGRPPGEAMELPPEKDSTEPSDNLVAGRRVTRLTNVSQPTLEIFRPEPDRDTGTSVIICPGGGHWVLAYDLEGSEVARWLNSIGVTGIVLKYRVPFRDEDQRWRAAVQDAQRCVSVVRHHSATWQLDPERIGICGFSAGGQTAAYTALLGNQRSYKPVDEADENPCRPGFAILVYSGGFVDKAGTTKTDAPAVTSHAPPMFLVHTHDDDVSSLNSVLLYSALKRKGVAAELHIYARGGHGYGLRQTELPVTRWPQHCEAWLNASGLLTSTDLPEVPKADSP